MTDSAVGNIEPGGILWGVLQDPEPHAVVLGACDAIAASLNGFRYAPSQRHATRSRGDWKDLVYFQASVYNRRGRSITLYVGINLRNRHLARWRKEVRSPVRTDDWVAGCYLGYLADDGRGAQGWDLLSGSARAVRDICGRLNADAMPFFAACSDLGRFLDLVPTRWLDIFTPPDLFELFLCYGKAEPLDRYLAGLWENRAEIRDLTIEWLADGGRLKSRIGVVAPSNYGEALARLLEHHRMTDRVRA